ncbi:MAG: hypothetical protein ACI8QC_000764 [Planctomycetota bacterium]|jgi:hypothetical protein
MQRLLFAPILAGLLVGQSSAQVDDLLDDILGDEPVLLSKDGQDEEDGLDDFGLDELLGGGDLESGEASGVPDALREWKGFVEMRPRRYLEDRGGPKHDEQWILEAELELDFRLGESLSGYFRPRVYLDLFDGELSRFAPYEAYVTKVGDDWDLRAGQFVENWGIVDTYNPIDVVSRRDLATDFLNAERLGEIGLRYRRFLDGGEVIGEPTVSLYVLPVWQATEFPPDDQRFGFGSSASPFNESRGFEPHGSERAFYAMRFASTVSSAPLNADVQFLLSHGPERMPGVAMVGSELVPAYFGATTVGLGFRAVPNQDVAGDLLSTLTFKAEVAYKNPSAFDDSPIESPDDYVAYVLGLDRDFYGLAGEQDQLTLMLEYAGEEGADGDPIGDLRPFRDDLIVRAFYQPHDFARTTYEARGIYDLETDEVIYELLYTRQLRSLSENIKFIAQLQGFDTGGEGLFDFFPDNTSIALGLRLDF